ncbi:unnamed protein product [Caenorhabditis auriculariae]|uniref:Translocon-associated protein subunit beta n=1 Tax=Caenorhabditis auriculariae TaxID=2777116 RepID=A0A8S1H137_9PELO|nr:unnamed protein product [Caenorhabditis auriculariae]
MFAKLALVALLSAVAYTVDVETQTTEAFILAHKSPLSLYAVENMDLVIEYGIYNNGDKPAKKVTLDDRHSFPTQSFDIIKGLLHVHFESVGARSNVTHSVVVRPRAFGMFNYTSAQVSYFTESNDLHVAYTNTPGEGYIYRQKEYDRKFSPKYIFFVVFAIVVAPTTLGSYLLFLKSKSRFEEFSKKKSQ